MGISELSVSVDRVGDPFAYGIKVAHDLFELNVWLRREELALFARVPAAVWERGGALAIGVSAQAPAFWCASGDRVSILVGHDPETWDFTVSLPMGAFERMVDALERESGEPIWGPT